MKPFSFETTPSIRCGSGIGKDVAAIVAPVLGRRVLIVTDAMKQTRLLVNNPREVTERDALAIYQAAF
jgi:alcohol dehydrogenase class IV